MSTEKLKPNRRKFITWGLASAAVIAAFNFFKTSSSSKPKTVKMLTREGNLVEVDIAAIPPQRKKITNGELQGWIKINQQDKSNQLK